MMSESSLMIIAGEASGDMHGARLVHALHEMLPDLKVCGVGGDQLRAEGVEILFDAGKLAVVGLSEVLSHFVDIRAAMKLLENRLQKKPPRLLLLIDFPDFNLMLASKAKKLGIPVFYYISPQVWAWRSRRVKKIKRLVDRMAVILPFEKDFYRQHGMDVDFVGHPLLDSVRTSMTREQFFSKHSIDSDSVAVGILPGSRRKELAMMLPIFLQAARTIAAKHQKIVFLLPLASTLTLKDLEENGLPAHDITVKVIAGERYEVMGACDAVMAASGTVALELAILDVPMVVAYKISPLTHFLGSRLIKVPYASLVNLVAGEEVVPEVLQHDATPENIAWFVENILSKPKVKENMRSGFARVRQLLGGGGASKRAAEIALELISGRARG